MYKIIYYAYIMYINKFTYTKFHLFMTEIIHTFLIINIVKLHVN